MTIRHRITDAATASANPVKILISWSMQLANADSPGWKATPKARSRQRVKPAPRRRVARTQYFLFLRMIWAAAAAAEA